MPKKRQTAVPGTIFGIPRLDGQIVLGQVLEEYYPKILAIAVFDLAVPPTDSVDPALLSDLKVISITAVAQAEIAKGYWKVVGSAPLLADPAFSPHRKFSPPHYIGASWCSGGIIEKLVDAYYGLSTWEPYPGRPGHLKSLLLESGEAASN
ncbi:hypothetical protein PQQ99_37140 [Paraburkholderia sediminicola]|uniref:Uncharacterized protein n=1 Tax=Paraburkholderia metrosideri TaxID=580937 RepID=A0ABW9E591_9BURK